MAENKLEGFEDLDNVLGEGEAGAEAGAGGQDFAGELDDLLGGGGGEAGGAEGGAPESDSELDSFFEDLSTIDDLEVLQEEEPAAAEVAPEPELPEPEEEEEEAAPAQPAPRAAPAPVRERPRVAARPKPRKRGFFGRLVRWLVLLAIVGVGGYFVYHFFFPNLQPPWQVIKEKAKLISELQEQQPPPSPPPAPAPAPVQPAPRPRPRPAPRRPAPPREHGPWSIQVATCFFPSCVVAYRDYLHTQKRSVLVRDKLSRTRSLEIYSQSNWDDHQEAQTLADRINKQHPMEGHAFVLREDGGYRISMGAFSDLARANVVKDALNQQYLGQIVFATRVRSFPYKVQSVLTGRYPSRARAERALAALKDAEPRLHDAFVTRNDVGVHHK